MTSGASKKLAISHYELMPHELIEICLECKSISCRGECPRYKEKEKEIYNRIREEQGRKGIKKRGVQPKKYPFRGYSVTAIQMARLLGVTKTTIYRRLQEGLDMEAIYKEHEYKTLTSSTGKG